MEVESIPNLRPMKMGQILDRAARLYRNNFISFMGIVAMVQVPLAIVQVLISLQTLSNAGLSLGWTLLSGLLSFILLQGVGTAAMTRAVADSYLGEKTSALGAFRKIGRGWITLLVALFVLGLIAIAAILWWLVPCIGWITGLGILAYLAFVISPLVAPIIVLEGQNASQGWRRAWQLARKRFWWILGFFTVLSAFNLLVVIGPTTLATMLLQFLWESSISDPQTIFTIQILAQQLVAVAVSLLFLPFQLAAITLVYLDLRVRSEGFDLAIRVKRLEGQQLDAANLLAEAPRADQSSLITSRELAYFAGLSLIPIGLYLAVIFAMFAFFAILEAGM